MDENNLDEQELQDDVQSSDLERQLAEAQEEAATNLAGWQRAQADFANYQKREEEKQKDILDFAKEVTIVKLLPTLDTLLQGLKHVPQDVDPNWLKGIQHTMNQLGQTLGEMGIKPVQADVGQKFDPHLHEAIREVVGEEDGLITEVLLTGYEINGKVIRPSQVVISKQQ